MKVRGYSGTAIPVKGRCLVEVTHKDRERTLAFVVVHRDVQAILGLAACERLNLVKRSNITWGFKESFWTWYLC